MVFDQELYLLLDDMADLTESLCKLFFAKRRETLLMGLGMADAILSEKVLKSDLM